MVLLYEPDPDLAPLWQFLLACQGQTVQLATTLDEVLERAPAPPPALVVVRPAAGAGGWAVCQQIQVRFGVPVIGLLPAEASSEPTADLHLLPLPVDPAALRAVVQRLAARAS